MTDSFRRIIMLLVLVSAFSYPLYSEDRVLLPEEESPESFYEVSIDNENVELFLAGSWKAELSASTSFGWSGGKFNPDLSYSGFSEGFSFSQSPDLTVSLIILEKFLFDAAFTDKFEDSTFRIGYLGDEDDFIKIVSAGNMGISLSEQTGMSEYFYVPGGGPSSFGIYSLLESSFSEHELLFRFDPQEELRKLYIGGDILVEIEKQPSEYLRGRLFYLEDSPSDIIFYLEAGNGGYSLLEAEDYTWSLSSGRLYLKEDPAAAVIALSSEKGWTFDSPKLLYDPGIITEHEALSAYKIDAALPDDDWKTRVFLAESAESASSGLELSTDIIPDDGIVIIGPAAGGSVLYPLQGVIPDSGKIYGNTSADGARTSAGKLWFRIRESASGYSVDNPVPGSIRIYINGTESLEWTESGGVITFNSEPAATDRIEIVYRRNTGSEGGDLLFASANRFTITDSLRANLDAGGRWNISGGWALPGDETAAWGGVAAGINYSSPDDAASPLRISAGLSGGVRMLVANSTGRLLLKNMSSDMLDVGINRYTVFPSSLSAKIASAEGISAADRGRLNYRDYRSSTAVGTYYLRDYTDQIDADKIFEPENSTAADRYPAGPYTAAASSDSRTGEIAVMDYELDAAGSWVGIQIPLNAAGDNINLSAASALTLDYKTDADLSNIALYIEAGSVSEDLDGDGKLDAESSQYSAGYIFDDPNTSAGTLIGADSLGGSNGKLDTEDINGNGILDTDAYGINGVDGSDAVVFFGPVQNPGSSWKRLRLYFTDADGSSCRARLRDAEFIRITAVKQGGPAESGRIMFDEIRFEGSSFASSDDTGLVQPEKTELAEASVPPAELASAPLSGPTIDSGAANSVMRLEWDQDWKIFSYISPVEADDYASITFSYYAPSLTAAAGETPMLCLSLKDSGDRGLEASVPLTTGDEWNTVTLSYPAAGGTGTAEINGAAAPGASVNFDSGTGSLSLIEFYAEGTDEGVIYLDEIFLGDPALRTNGGVTADLSLEWSEPLLKIGDLELIGPLNTSHKGSADFDLGTGGTAEGLAGIDYAAELQTGILGAGVAADISISGPDGMLLAGGHSVILPFSVIGLTLSDGFHIDNSSDGDFLRNISAAFTAGFFNLGAGFSAVRDSLRLNRSWDADAGISAGIFNLDLSAGFLLSDSDTSISRGGYFDSWYSASALAADLTASGLIQRKTVFKLSSALSGDTAGLNIEASIAADIDSDSEAEDSVDINLRVPLNIGDGASALHTEIGYSRSASFGHTASSAVFSSDIASMFKSAGTGGLFYSSVPYYELFDPSLPGNLYDSSTGAGCDEASFSSKADLSLSREYSSRLTDLILPYSFETSFSRTTVKEFEQIEDALSFNLIWRSAALNLFGAAGLYPVFGFYFSDELNWSVETAFREPFSDSPSAETHCKGGLSFFGHEQDILSADFSVYFPWKIEDAETRGSTSLQYIWNAQTEKPLNLPLFSEEDEMFQMITNEEKLSLFFEDSFRAELKHTTSLILPGRFTLSAFGLAGWSLSTESEIKTSVIGLSFGLSGSIIY